MKNRRMTSIGIATMTAAALMLLVSPSAEARRHPFGPGGLGPGGHGHGPGHFGKKHRRGKGMRMMRCMKKLFFAPPFMLKEKMGLSDQQIKKIEKIRDNFAQKRITYRANLARQRLVMRKLMQKDLPEVNQVLQAARKARNIRGKLQEEKLKAGLWIMGTLSPEQRKAFRKRCFMGKRGRFGRFGHRGPRGRFGKGGPQR